MIIGDCSATTQQKNTISTPGIGFIRKLAKHFTVYMIDEFRTSCLGYVKEDRCNNLYITDDEGIKRKIYSVLTYQMNNNRYGIINRDKNAVNNMKKITNSYLNNKERPIRYRHETKIDNNQKGEMTP